MTPSRILRPGMKAVCEGLIILSATAPTLLVRTLVFVLKLTLSKQIGRYS
jgi:hypothetical protein